MESNNVRQLFLVDQLDRVYKQLQRPVQAVAVEKVRRYIDELYRYLHLRDVRPQQQQQLRPKHIAVCKKLPLSITTHRPPPPPVPAPPSPRKLRSTSTVANDDEDGEVFFAKPAAAAAATKSSPVPRTRRKKKTKFNSDDWSKNQRK